jgi:hypothetical protein
MNHGYWRIIGRNYWKTVKIDDGEGSDDAT